MRRNPAPRDNADAAYAWWRYRRVMRWLMAVTVALMVAAVRLAGQHAADASVRRFVVAALVTSLVMLGTSGLMGLVFLRNGSWKTKRSSMKARADENLQPEPRRSDAPE